MRNYTEPSAAAALEAKRAKLADALDRHHWREKRIVLGVASPETVACVLRNRHLSRVLAGPRRLIGLRGQRGVATASVLAGLAVALVLGGYGLALYNATTRTRAEHDWQCKAIARAYYNAQPGSAAEILALGEMDRQNCYLEDAGL